MTTQQKPLYGILLILCAGSLLATHDGVSKHLTHLYPLVMVIWARYAVQSVVMFLLFFPKMRWAIVRTRRPLLQLLRALSLLRFSGLLIVGWGIFPFGEAPALWFLEPLFVPDLRQAFLTEKFTKGKW